MTSSVRPRSYTTRTRHATPHLAPAAIPEAVSEWAFGGKVRIAETFSFLQALAGVPKEKDAEARQLLDDIRQGLVKINGAIDAK